MIGSSGVALADDAAAPKVDTGDTAWLLASSALVLLMTPGLALFYAGMVRAKNALSVMMQSFFAMGIVTILWVVCGYSLAFAKGNPFIGTMQWAGLNGVGLDPNATYGATVPHQAFMIFQMMFAIITPALISGAVVERIKFSTYAVFISLWSLLVYVPLAHMVWGEGGYLRDLGALDFAGGTVVHISSGVSALVLAILLGKRRGSPAAFRAHNVPMILIGTGLLWFGWFGFNAGSAIGSNGLATSAFVVTHIAAATAGVVWTILEWMKHKTPSTVGFATGAVAGLVAITPASGFVGPLAAIAIGAGVSVISFGAVQLKAKFGYDDALDVFGVHGVGGMWGALATGLFASKVINSAGADGVFFGGGMVLLTKQLIAVGAAVGYAAIVTLILGLALKAVMGLSVTPAQVEEGLDSTLHGESAYGEPAYGSAAVVFSPGMEGHVADHTPIPVPATGTLI